MPAANYNLVAEQGSSYNKTLTVRDTTDALMDLTGYTARMHVRERYSAEAKLIDLTTENGGISLGGALGTISLSISAASLAEIAVPDQPGTPPSRACVYDLELVFGAAVTRLLQGKFTIYREVTR
jgi:hypothetical protein